MENRISSMEKFFSPRSVAFIGASNSLLKWGGLVFLNLISGGYQGKILPVNPKEETVLGLKAYPTVLDIPDEVDVAVLVIPAKAVPQAITQCVEKGIKAGIVITAGFAELGAEGEALQEEMLARAREGGMVLIGPNCQGIAAPDCKFYPWLPAFSPDPGVIGIASQSGGISTELSQDLALFGFGCSKVISVGNCADLSWDNYLDYFRKDPATKVILLYLEGIQSGKEFFRAAKKAALEKPVIVLKGGITEAGGKATASHTASMAGSNRVFDAACKQAGVIRVNTLNDAIVTAAAFVKAPLGRGKRICVLTGGGGQGVLAADAASHKSLELAPLSESTVEKLREHLPPWWGPNNPVDMVAGLGFGGPKKIIPILLESGDYDGIIYNGIGWIYTMLDPVNAERDLSDPEVIKWVKPLLDEANELSDALLEIIADSDIPVLITAKGTESAIRRKYEAVNKFLDQDVMVYPTSEDAVNTFQALHERYEFLNREKKPDCTSFRKAG